MYSFVIAKTCTSPPKVWLSGRYARLIPKKTGKGPCEGGWMVPHGKLCLPNCLPGYAPSASRPDFRQTIPGVKDYHLRVPCPLPWLEGVQSNHSFIEVFKSTMIPPPAKNRIGAFVLLSVFTQHVKGLSLCVSVYIYIHIISGHWYLQIFRAQNHSGGSVD